MGLFDQIKGMAILFVVLTHLPFWDAGTRLGLGFPFWVDQAVPLFMVTSGFVLFRDTSGEGGAPRRLARLLIPYTISFVAMMAVLKARNGASVETSVATVLGLSLGEAESLGKPLATLALFVCGGPGPGGYYIPVLVELYLLAPLLRRVLSAGPKGLAAAALAVLLWGFAAQSGVVSPQVYRLVVIRYVPYILIGGWLRRRLAASALTASRTSLAVLSLSGVAGGGYLLSVNYLGMTPVATAGWQSTSSLAACWLLPWVWAAALLLQDNGNVVCPGVLGEFLSRVGRATLHIYLVQMVYYLWLGVGQGLRWGPLMLGSVAVCVFYWTLWSGCAGAVRKKIAVAADKTSRAK